MDEDFLYGGGESSGGNSNLKLILIVLAIIFVLIGLIIGAYFFFKPASGTASFNISIDTPGNGIGVNITNQSGGGGGSGIGVGDNGTTNTSGGDGDFMGYEFYDVNGNPINLSSYNLLSVVNGAPNIAFIRLTISLKNTGSLVLSCKMKNVNPSWITFISQTDEKPILPGKKVSWTSNLINISKFEGAPIVDVINISTGCTYNLGDIVRNLPDKYGIFKLVVFPDNNVTYTRLRIDKQGNYLAYTELCGTTLKAYYKNGQGGCDTYTGDVCPSYISTNNSVFTLIMKDSTQFPAPNWGVPGIGCLYHSYNSQTGQERMLTAWKVRANGGQFCTIQGRWSWFIYNPTTSGIPTSPNLLNQPTLYTEMNCSTVYRG